MKNLLGKYFYTGPVCQTNPVNNCLLLADIQNLCVVCSS